VFLGVGWHKSSMKKVSWKAKQKIRISRAKRRLRKLDDKKKYDQ
jgi:hypothetical protein